MLLRRIMKEIKATHLKAKGEVWHRARAKGSLRSRPGAHGEAGGGQGALTPLKPPESLSHLNIFQALSWKQRPESSPVLLNMNKACSPSIIEQPGGTRRRRLPARVLPCCSRGQRPEVANAPRNSGRWPMPQGIRPQLRFEGQISLPCSPNMQQPLRLAAL